MIPYTLNLEFPELCETTAIFFKALLKNKFNQKNDYTADNAVPERPKHIKTHRGEPCKRAQYEVLRNIG
jgi:hypothetical protein